MTSLALALVWREPRAYWRARQGLWRYENHRYTGYITKLPPEALF
jgi:hypothetical protein